MTNQNVLPDQFRVWSTLRIGLGVWTRNLVAFSALAIVVNAPYILWAISVARGDADPSAIASFDRWSPLLRYLLNTVLSAAVTYGVVMRLDRRPAPFVAVIGKGLRRFLPALAVALLAVLVVGLATILLIIPGIIVMCMFYVAVPVAVVERRGIVGALSRSRELSDGSKWRVLGLIVVAFGALMLGAFAVGAGLAILDRDPSHRALTLAEVGFDVLLGGPMGASIVATAYVILRRQKDGVATSELAEVFE